MFLFAALLGADHTTNHNASSRQLFKLLALVFAVPVLLDAGLGLLESIGSSNWLAATGALLRLVLFVLAVLMVAFDHHPLVRRTIARLGFSGSPAEVKSK
jgi:hypothetical protein